MNLPILDIVAVLWFFTLVVVYEIISRRNRNSAKSIAGAVQEHRRMWMLRMSERENRIMDSQLLGWLVNANAFFASTSAIAVGGLAALIGYGEMARPVFEDLPYAAPHVDGLWEFKVLFLVAIMIIAFFKFAWAFRLSHYTVIMVGATPDAKTPDADARKKHAAQTADVLGLLGEHANQGLRAFYYTIAGLTWFFHPLAFMVAIAWVLMILLRRDYYSKSRLYISGD